MCDAHNRICSGVERALHTYNPACGGCLFGFTLHLLRAARDHGDQVGPGLQAIIAKVAKANWSRRPANSNAARQVAQR
jgi:hypothetical protein